MDIFEAMKTRHSVRVYFEEKIADAIAEKLFEDIETSNGESGLRIQLFLNEPEAFHGGMMARYGSFRNANNYIAMVGKKNPGLDETCGYYGEKIVLTATQLGLGSCWVGISYSKGKCKAQIAEDEKLVIVVALGNTAKEGVPHKTKTIEQISRVNGEMPDWFRRGMEAVQLAPTALNQQKFLFTLDQDTVRAKAGLGFYAKVDLGIAKCHFELGAGTDGWRWAE